MNRARTAIKILVYDGQGFWLCLPSACPAANSLFWLDAEQPSRVRQAC